MENKKTERGLQDTETKILEIVRSLLKELGGERAIRVLSPEASLDRDLGLGSLERVELFMRVEQAFSVRLTDRVLGEVETPKDIAAAIVDSDSTEAHIRPQHRLRSFGTRVDAPSGRTLDEALVQFAEYEGDRPHIVLQKEDGQEKTLTYGDLLDAARKVAGGLLARGLKRGDTVAVMLPTGEEFFASFLGVVLAGGIVVPIYPPYRADRIEEYAQRQSLILRNARVRVLITFPQAETLSVLLKSFVPTLEEVTSLKKLKRSDYPSRFPFNHPEESVLIQYTSGSTSDPKGVLLTHSNILANIRSIGKAAEIGPSDVGVSWLPLYHDMGLIGSWLCSLFYGFPVAILSPFSFLNRPERWLWAIHYHRATLSPAPNFAYELCLRKIDDDKIRGLDLSSWRLAFNGAEAINPETLLKFQERFAPYGLRSETLFPVYGLAETCVALTFPPLGRPPRVDRIERETFQREHIARPASASGGSVLQFVSCGFPLPDHEVRIVDENGLEVPDRTEGNLLFRGPSSMKGYFQSPDATRAAYREGWLDSGDLAYRADGEIFITGRRKDVIIKGGRNLYPQEIEEVAAEVDGIRKGCVAAFGISEARLGTERLVVVGETRETRPDQKARMEQEVVERISANVGVPPDQVVLIPPGQIPKTSSGKIRRSACRDQFLRGEFVRRRRPVWAQMAKLIAGGIGSRAKRSVGVAARWVYAGYALLIILLTVPPVWAAVAIYGKKEFSASLARKWSILFLQLMGCPLSVHGMERFPKSKACVIVANHASYIDSIVLMAALPPRFVFVVKQELARAPVIGTFIRRVGHITVDRADVSKSVEDARRIEETLRRGISVLIFPEGTFTPVTGLRPFKLGAFKVAVETSTPVCPLGLRGTRQVLWPDQWLPRRGPVSVEIGMPIEPEGKDWREMTRLRESSRQIIAQHCGENPISIVAAGPPVPGEKL